MGMKKEGMKEEIWNKKSRMSAQFTQEHYKNKVHIRAIAFFESLALYRTKACDYKQQLINSGS